MPVWMEVHVCVCVLPCCHVLLQGARVMSEVGRGALDIINCYQSSTKEITWVVMSVF